MYFVIVCACGFPVGHLWRKYILAKLLTNTENAIDISTIMADIEKTFQDDWEQVSDFIQTSYCHMRIFQALDPKKGLLDLVAQYNKIYPFEEMMLPQSLANRIATDKNVQRFFVILFNVSQRALTDDRRPQSKVNLIKELLDSEGVTKMCCRQTILTSCDFYESMAFYANVLQ